MGNLKIKQNKQKRNFAEGQGEIHLMGRTCLSKHLGALHQQCWSACGSWGTQSRWEDSPGLCPAHISPGSSSQTGQAGDTTTPCLV